jgi:hypothetical protein
VFIEPGAHGASAGAATIASLPGRLA